MRPKTGNVSAADFRLILTRGGGAELLWLEEQETVWCSEEDEDFRAEFPDFLNYDDVWDILEYLEEVGELTSNDADNCEIAEEYIDATDLAGMMRTL